MSKKNSMKAPRCASSLRPSRLVRVLLLLGSFKAALLLSLLLPSLEQSLTDYSAPGALPEEARLLADNGAKGQVFRYNPNGSTPIALDEKGQPLLAPEQSQAEAQADNQALLAYPPMAKASPQALQASEDLTLALAAATSEYTLGLPRIIASAQAQTSALPSMQDIVPPAPTIRNPPQSDLATLRPDERPLMEAPVPEVGPFISRDGAAQKQAEINRREQELLALQQQMDTRMKELHNLENRLQGMIQDAGNSQDGKMAQLIQTYSTMKPRVAAQSLTSMDESLAVKILTGMRSKNSGEIMSYMDPRQAARLSEAMSKVTF